MSASVEAWIKGSCDPFQVPPPRRANRHGNRLELTSTGQRLADAVGAGLGHVRDVLASLKQRNVNRTLTIACSHDLAQNWLLPRFRELAELLHDWKLRVITAASYEDFDAADIDLSIRSAMAIGRASLPFTCLPRRDSRSVRPRCSSAIQNSRTHRPGP